MRQYACARRDEAPTGFSRVPEPPSWCGESYSSGLSGTCKPVFCASVQRHAIRPGSILLPSNRICGLASVGRAWTRLAKAKFSTRGKSLCQAMGFTQVAESEPVTLKPLGDDLARCADPIIACRLVCRSVGLNPISEYDPIPQNHDCLAYVCECCRDNAAVGATSSLNKVCCTGGR